MLPVLPRIDIPPAELDRQSRVRIDRWLDVESQECRDLDDMPDFTRQCLRAGADGGFMFVDVLGRIWGRGTGGYFYPFHFEHGSKLYGYRLASTALN